MSIETFPEIAFFFVWRNAEGDFFVCVLSFAVDEHLLSEEILLKKNDNMLLEKVRF